MWRTLSQKNSDRRIGAISRGRSSEGGSTWQHQLTRAIGALAGAPRWVYSGYVKRPRQKCIPNADVIIGSALAPPRDARDGAHGALKRMTENP